MRKKTEYIRLVISSHSPMGDFLSSILLFLFCRVYLIERSDKNKLNPQKKRRVMKLNANIKKGVMIALMAVVCMTATARPHHHHRHHVVKPQITTVVISRPVVKVKKAAHKKPVATKVVVVKKVYKR